MKLVTAEQMRELEAAAVAAGSSVAQMMEEAGLAVAQEAWMLLGTLEGRKIVVLAGPGKNGGDGLVAARHLADWGAEVVSYLPRGHKTPERVEELRAREQTVIEGDNDPDGTALRETLAGADLVIDALLGIGKKRPLEADEPMTRALVALKEARAAFQPPKVLAVDLPTGIDADSGAADPETVPPDMTVTFGLPKIGMYQAPASDLLGKVQVIDIGIPKAALESVQLELVTARWARGVLPDRPADANKGTFGRVLVVGGSSQYSGAPMLAALGAYRAGAGLVTVACPAEVRSRIAGALPEATWLSIPEHEGERIAGEAAVALRGQLAGFSSAVVGPGMGDSEETRAFVWAALLDLGGLPNGTVLDADGLNALAALPDASERVPSNAVLTPHPGELARLLRTTVADVQRRRLAAAKEAAAEFRCVVVLKGAHSVIAAADGRASLSPFANPLLATAGSGDVLAGMIGAYLAQGLAPFEAACLGVYLHGATGEALGAEYGRAGLLAREIADRLPAVARDVAAP